MQIIISYAILEIEFLGLLLLILYHTILLRKVVLTLKSDYPDKYEELGRPSWFVRSGAGLSLVRFLFTADQNQYPVVPLKRCKKTLSYTIIVFVLTFLSMIVIGIMNS